MSKRNLRRILKSETENFLAEFNQIGQENNLEDIEIVENSEKKNFVVF